MSAPMLKRMCVAFLTYRWFYAFALAMGFILTATYFMTKDPGVSRHRRLHDRHDSTGDRHEPWGDRRHHRRQGREAGESYASRSHPGEGLAARPL